MSYPSSSLSSTHDKSTHSEVQCASWEHSSLVKSVWNLNSTEEPPLYDWTRSKPLGGICLSLNDILSPWLAEGKVGVKFFAIYILWQQAQANDCLRSHAEAETTTFNVSPQSWLKPSSPNEISWFWLKES